MRMAYFTKNSKCCAKKLMRIAHFTENSKYRHNNVALDLKDLKLDKQVYHKLSVLN